MPGKGHSAVETLRVTKEAAALVFFVFGAGFAARAVVAKDVGAPGPAGISSGPVVADRMSPDLRADHDDRYMLRREFIEQLGAMRQTLDELSRAISALAISQARLDARLERLDGDGR